MLLLVQMVQGKRLFLIVLQTIFLLLQEQCILKGKDITKLPAHRLVHLGMARTFQKNNLFGDLTVEENIHLALTAKKNLST